MKNRFIYIILAIFLMGDFSWSFIQYRDTMLDGDMAGGIVPNEQVREILADPFGFNLLAENEPHANPNRYFSHLMFREYFLNIPHFLQNFTSPVESIYLACALIKILIHVLILYLLSALITKSKSMLKMEVLFIAALLTPLFQTYGYNQDIGIIDVSITYTFFYALPILLLLLFIFLFKDWILDGNKPLTLAKQIFLLLFSLILPFTGPLISPVILIISFFLFLFYIFSRFKIHDRKNDGPIKSANFHIPKEARLIYIAITITSLYSLYLGTFDNQFENDAIPISERYSRLLTGLSDTFLVKSGFSSLFQLIIFNSIVLMLFYKEYRRKITTVLIFITAFAVIYLSLLPLGGYRPYRENIIRYDTIMPVTIALFYICGSSTFLLINRIKTNIMMRLAYLSIIIVFIYSYTKKDTDIKYDNRSEKEALTIISESDEKIVFLKNECQILSWTVITDYNASKMNGKLMQMLGMTKYAKMYYTVPSAMNCNLDR